MMRKFSRKQKISILVAAAILVAAIVSAPFLIQAAAKWPIVQYYRLTVLTDTIEKRQIYWEEGDNPMLFAYQTCFETEEEPSSSEIRTAFLSLLREDPDAYYTLANYMLSQYDKYSKLLSQEQYDRLYPENENYGGLGMVISAYEPFIRVVNVYEDSAASAAGVQPGDLIACINGTDIRPLPYDAASELLKAVSAEGGSIAVLREGKASLLTFDLTPAEVVIPNVDWHVDGEIAYLNVTLFSGSDFNDLVDAAFADFREAGASRLLLDMRDNRGGTINLLVHLLDALTPEEGVLMFTEDKRNETIEHVSTGVGMAFDEVVVLANADTCSSAEVCTGYMKDCGYPVVGTVTYGKGTGLSILDFYGDVLVIATIDIQLPETGRYNGVGITPTVEVEETYAPAELPDLLPLQTQFRITAESAAPDIEAMEERLSLLGYFFETPDGVWDQATTTAVERVAELAGCYGAAPEMLALLENMTVRLAEARYFVDTQLETAYEIIRAAEMPAA